MMYVLRPETWGHGATVDCDGRGFRRWWGVRAKVLGFEPGVNHVDGSILGRHEA